MWVLHQLSETRRHKTRTGAVPSIDPQSQPSSAEKAKAPRAQVGSAWGFSPEEINRFPALRRRNFWCIQRHQARALHYDLRMQLDGSTVSWAIPKGLLGISKRKEAHRLAVETTLHPNSYTTHEGSDGRTLPSGLRGGTLLWDVGYYLITPKPQEDDGMETDNEDMTRKRRRMQYGDDESDGLGADHESAFRRAFHKHPRAGGVKSIHFTLTGGRKMTDHTFILILPSSNSRSIGYESSGRVKKTWFISLPRGVEEYSWGPEGEEGAQYGRSVKTGRTLREVCNSTPYIWQPWPNEPVEWADARREIDATDRVS
ncbi:DNA polymerase ligase-domain-containing protein [Naematelia encephala]|uniref:DNA polymerase ligase-domain-containing protein n=1 Tax=Naematelia encephala TaxID=71784 RepID=A0A1Y2BCI0_9TREE|nr:DNA polymerase ligase-domain-containing protein [Naematelia encephala]